MPNLYSLAIGGEVKEKKLSKEEVLAVYYHNIFDFPLDLSELIKWTPSQALLDSDNLSVSSQNGYFFLEGSEGNIYKRALRKRISVKKMEKASKSARLLSLIPTIKLVAVTGSLAMQNAADESDLDLLIVTKSNSLWTTRLLSYLLLSVLKIPFRRSGEKEQKDKLCLNIWLDEGDLDWNRKERNLYTSHEIAQIVPLVNKDKTYERFVWQNRWIREYWPNAVRIKKAIEISEKHTHIQILTRFASTLERLAYKFQFSRMKSKITREVVTPTRALFHPQDWSNVVLDRLNSLPLE